MMPMIGIGWGHNSIQQKIGPLTFEIALLNWKEFHIEISFLLKEKKEEKQNGLYHDLPILITGNQYLDKLDVGIIYSVQRFAGFF